MYTTRQKLSMAGMEWRVDDPNYQRGLSRLFKDLQAMMSEEQVQKVLLKTQETTLLPGRPGSVKYPRIPVLHVQAVGEVTIHKTKSQKRSNRHAA